MKKGVLLVLCLFTISFVFAGYEVHTISIETSYPFNQILQGEMNITLESFLSTSILSSNMDHSALFFDFLKNNSAIYDCTPDDCSTGYSEVDSGTTLTFDPSDGNAVFGLFVNGTDISVSTLDFEISSDFPAGPVSPLSFYFFEDPENSWRFTYFTENEYHNPDYGYYRSSNANLDRSLGSWTYCNDLIFFETDTVLIGSDLVIVGNATGYVEILVFNDVGSPLTGGSNRLLYNPHVQNGVKFTASDGALFSNGHYFVCMQAYNESAEDYLIYSDELTGEYSGFNYPGQEFDHAAAAAERTASYSIFIQEAFYAGATKFETEGANFSGNLAHVNSFLASKYTGDCSTGCFLPFVVSGISQNLTLKNIDLSYADTNGPVSNPDLKVYKLEENPSLIDFSGVLDLSSLGFVLNESGDFNLFIDGVELDELDEEIMITAAPIIVGIFPNSVPAGIESTLVVELDSNVLDVDSVNLAYEWDFGDGTSTITTENKVTHTYTNVSEYRVRVTVFDGNLSNSFERTVFSVSPRDYVSVIYQQLSISLNESLDDIATFPVWQQGILKNALNVVESEDELNRIGRLIDQALHDNDYLAIALRLSELDIPRKVITSESYSYNIPLTEDANIEGFSAYTGESLSSSYTHDEYVDAVVRWQNVNADFLVSVSTLSLLRTSGLLEDIMKVYDVSFTNNFGGDSYLVLETPRDQLTFQSLSREPKSQDGVTIFPVSEGESLNVMFYTLGFDETTLFATPDIRYLVLTAEINEDCNFNLICEEGEDYNVCRSDCKPVLPMIFLIILICFVALVLYTIIQIWYNSYYEHQLFPDKNRLYNLLMYIAAAQSKGLSRGDVKRSLREKGWTNERIEYAVRRANGERAGLYEIIPLSKFSAKSRKNVAKKNPHMGASVPTPHGLPPQRAQAISRPDPVPSRDATDSKQQRRGNINKGDSQHFSTGGK